MGRNEGYFLIYAWRNIMKSSLRVSVVEGMQLVAAMAGPFLSKLMKYHFGTIAVFIGRCLVMEKPSIWSKLSRNAKETFKGKNIFFPNKSQM